eukprot:SM000068S20551  [mRNA]  locus=s68:101824:104545:+ [translate_table: standard]
MAAYQQITLYSYYQSSCSYRVRIALNLKGLKYKYIAVNIHPNTNEQVSDDFKKVNPASMVPVLVVDDHLLSESTAICEVALKCWLACLPLCNYNSLLEEKFPDPPILPSDVYKRAHVRKVVQIINAGIQPLQGSGVVAYVKEKYGQEDVIPWSQTWITKGFEALEQFLQTSAGKYCFGDQVTMADVFLVPQVFNARRFEVDLAKYPLLERISSALLEIPEFQAASPKEQPDAPKS